MRGLEKRVKALEELAGFDKQIAIYLWGPLSKEEISAAVREAAAREGVPEKQINPTVCRWRSERDQA